MKPLEQKFIFKGFRFTQVIRTKDFAIYLKENDVPSESPVYYSIYEVIKVRIREAESFRLFGKVINLPHREVYPTDNDWGLYGWTFQDLNSASAYFIKLIKKVACTSSRKVKNSKLDEYQLDIFSTIINV